MPPGAEFLGFRPAFPLFTNFLCSHIVGRWNFSFVIDIGILLVVETCLYDRCCSRLYHIIIASSLARSVCLLACLPNIVCILPSNSSCALIVQQHVCFIAIPPSRTIVIHQTQHPEIPPSCFSFTSNRLHQINRASLQLLPSPKTPPTWPPRSITTRTVSTDLRSAAPIHLHLQIPISPISHALAHTTSLDHSTNLTDPEKISAASLPPISPAPHAPSTHRFGA